MGVSQVSIENEFYMVDLPIILEEKAKEKSARLLEQIMILIATNDRHMEEGEYKKLINNITNQLDKQEETCQFDREKFEQLRFLTNMGANRM
ncbi:hypothetical protein [Heyndrickxia oleronia]|uniref:hypothetical protein n=1 Tax=Heyndrickxia oleronia TaxID=38875 RepID=UPI001C0EDEFF|nr:hypothetical protein [Heyndrickxia oleronia]MBU5214959.1 hypothetical protein [Heyndrickxia oleronia]